MSLDIVARIDAGLTGLRQGETSQPGNAGGRISAVEKTALSYDGSILSKEAGLAVIKIATEAFSLLASSTPQRTREFLDALNTDNFSGCVTAIDSSLAPYANQAVRRVLAEPAQRACSNLEFLRDLLQILGEHSSPAGVPPSPLDTFEAAVALAEPYVAEGDRKFAVSILTKLAHSLREWSELCPDDHPYWGGDLKRGAAELYDALIPALRPAASDNSIRQALESAGSFLAIKSTHISRTIDRYSTQPEDAAMVRADLAPSLLFTTIEAGLIELALEYMQPRPQGENRTEVRTTPRRNS